MITVRFYFGQWFLFKWIAMSTDKRTFIHKFKRAKKKNKIKTRQQNVRWREERKKWTRFGEGRHKHLQRIRNELDPTQKRPSEKLE